EKVEDQARRTHSVQNLRQIAVAMQAYHDTHKRFPPAAIYGMDGKPLLSWRVALLPYLEQSNLYNEFNLVEPWDGPHTKQLLARMPGVFAPGPGPARGRTSTFYQVFTGPDTLFPGRGALGMDAIKDGSSNTLLVIEAGTAVPWTKPEDPPYDRDKMLPPPCGGFPDGVPALLAGGEAGLLDPKIDPQNLPAPAP